MNMIVRDSCTINKKRWSSWRAPNKAFLQVSLCFFGPSFRSQTPGDRSNHGGDGVDDHGQRRCCHRHDATNGSPTNGLSDINVINSSLVNSGLTNVFTTNGWSLIMVNQFMLIMNHLPLVMRITKQLTQSSGRCWSSGPPVQPRSSRMDSIIQWLLLFPHTHLWQYCSLGPVIIIQWLNRLSGVATRHTQPWQVSDLLRCYFHNAMFYQHPSNFRAATELRLRYGCQSLYMCWLSNDALDDNQTWIIMDIIGQAIPLGSPGGTNGDRKAVWPDNSPIGCMKHAPTRRFNPRIDISWWQPFTWQSSHPLEELLITSRNILRSALVEPPAEPAGDHHWQSHFKLVAVPSH